MESQTIKLIQIAITQVEDSGGVILINQEFKIYRDNNILCIDEINQH